MVDKVRPLKLEDVEGGGELNFTPTEADPSEDYLSAKGLVFENRDDTRIERSNDGSLQFIDPISGSVKLSGLTGGLPESHRNLDQLVHGIAENSFVEYIYSGNTVASVITWTNPSKVLKIREEVFTYSSNRIASIAKRQYDGSGILTETLTTTFTFAGNKLESESLALS